MVCSFVKNNNKIEDNRARQQGKSARKHPQYCHIKANLPDNQWVIVHGVLIRWDLNLGIAILSLNIK